MRFKEQSDQGEAIRHEQMVPESWKRDGHLLAELWVIK